MKMHGKTREGFIITLGAPVSSYLPQGEDRVTLFPVIQIADWFNKTSMQRAIKTRTSLSDEYFMQDI